MKPMLAQPVDKAKIPEFIADPVYYAELKLDGDRMMVIVDNGTIKVLNRQGMPKVAKLVPAIVNEFAFFDTGRWCFDGELMGTKAQLELHLFDLPVAEGVFTDDQPPLIDRRQVLEDLFTEWHPQRIRLVPCARTTAEKQALFDASKAMLAEGVMFKNKHSVYAPGKRSSTWIKAKHTSEVDAIVTDIGAQGKDNVVLSLLDPVAGKVVEIGRASALGKKPKPAVGDVWEVRYLYYTDADDRLYQPRLMRRRSTLVVKDGVTVSEGDKAYEECLVDQLVRTDKAAIDKIRSETT